MSPEGPLHCRPLVKPSGATGVVLLAAVLVGGVGPMTVRGDVDATRLEPVVARYLDRVNDPLTGYRAHRRLEAEGLGKSGWLEAWTSVVDGRMSYEILAEGGSEGVRRRVLHKVLESEQQAWENGEAQKSGITTINYSFLRADDQKAGTDDLLKVLLKPRRKGKLIVDGAMFLERTDAELVRVEGKLTSNPSFWISRVDVTKRYQQISGHNLPVEIDTVADLRFAGDATFRMTYRYTHVNGQSIGAPLSVAASTAR
jgi:hypothetical protein